jgi:hypothetical protein
LVSFCHLGYGGRVANRARVMALLLLGCRSEAR